MLKWPDWERLRHAFRPKKKKRRMPLHLETAVKPAERNYSPTEREALALKEGLIKFQPYIGGETILEVTDHAALTWSKTFQNVNRRLLTWGTVFATYPKLWIVH